MTQNIISYPQKPWMNIAAAIAQNRGSFAWEPA
jgi:hypothetical protein